MVDGIRIGGTRIDLLSDGVFEAPNDTLSDHRRGAAALAEALARWGERPFRVGVNCFLLRGPRGVEMVDAGTGAFWGPALGRAREALAGHGVAPADVDRVYLTHIHGDHAYGLLDGDAPHLPRADVIVPEADLSFYTDASARAAHEAHADPLAKEHSGFNIAARLAAAYGARLRPVPFGPVAPGVEMVPLPGHTPGQGGYLLSDGETSLLLLADALHLEVEQAVDPDLGTRFDVDSAQEAETRRAILSRAAEAGWVIGGGHIGGFGRVSPEGAGFRVAAP